MENPRAGAHLCRIKEPRFVFGGGNTFNHDLGRGKDEARTGPLGVFVHGLLNGPQ